MATHLLVGKVPACRQSVLQFAASSYKDPHPCASMAHQGFMVSDNIVSSESLRQTV